MTSIYVFNITHLDWIKLVDELTPLMLPVEEQDENTGQEDIECQSENDDINSPLTSGDEEDCDEILTIVPDFPDTVYDSDDDIVIYSRKDSYKAVASQFAKQAHPPTRIGSLPTSQLFHDLKSQEVCN
ncbi:PREDICTED: uncharacterized protein LOC109586625 [Amphimedon queenslandica]|uniref:Uncharacterized protein n=1 Tax=Amphimedon queenslandica TaxID=400682 RepID=A0AAN0JN00_AMPQE|nr:PREDICTED: uncharacterized protein LOC109586625 [Amphimedon queenslandica]|eukprot:XP_019858379.1 PREDICTED: uncharacterized protein LOC109586625 [Amphimedon queenslandica]